MSTRSTVYYDDENNLHFFYDLVEDHGCLYLEHGEGPYGLELQLPKDLSDALVDPLRRLAAIKRGDIRVRRDSYVDIAADILRDENRPLSIGCLVDMIRERRGDSAITRASVQTSLLRHLSTKGEAATFQKLDRGIYLTRPPVSSGKEK